MVIPAACHTPIQFKGIEYIRIGSYKKKLKDIPEKQKELWRKLSLTAFEKGIARSNATSEDVLRLIDYPGCFELLGITLPDSRVGILDRLQEQKVILTRGVDRYDLTNLGALLFAKRLDDFGRLGRKAVRVISYKTKNRLEPLKEQLSTNGYAVGFKNLIDYINSQLPMNEEIGRALRREFRMYPDVAVRELAANMIIHQDFSITGAGPMVEIFSDRVEFSNPGKPLMDTMRFLDLPPRSRNEDLAALMRRMSFCEERGSGIDKVVFSSEMLQLPAPTFDVRESTTVATLYAHKKFSQMDKNDRTWACYLHTCLRYVSNETMTNSSLRERFKIEPQNYAMVSRVISDTMERGWIRLRDPESRSRKHARYVPAWA
jgi:predicted HTH transcriptional regulator